MHSQQLKYKVSISERPIIQDILLYGAHIIWWWSKILVLPPFCFGIRAWATVMKRGANDIDCWGESSQTRLWTPFLGYQTHPRGAYKRAALPATHPCCHPFLPEPAKLIATDLVTHPVTCVIDIYIHMFTWLLFWGLGGICWIKS